MRIKKFFEMFSEDFDYDKIIKILRKSYGWGMGIITKIDEFEGNQEYFLDPQNDDDYIEQFNIFLKELSSNRLRGKFNNTQSLKMGKWKLGPNVNYPTSIYNKLY